jgi:tetratricopeptide (TPR) repeat protein
MKKLLRLGLLSSTIFVAGCSTNRLGSQVEAGRQDLLIGKNESAVNHFKDAAAKDPNYQKSIGYMREGVWTYLGRANYEAGKLTDARQALEQAVARSDRDYMAKLYLGLALARAENRELGTKNIANGLQGLSEWFRYTKGNAHYGRNWDPLNAISSEIDRDLAMLSGPAIDWPKLISSGEWIGKKTEEEIDLARRDENRQNNTDGGRRRMSRH